MSTSNGDVSVAPPTQEQRRAQLAGKSDRELLEAIAIWQAEANDLIRGLMDSVREVRENPALLFQGLMS
jgi:hypothetical protein